MPTASSPPISHSSPHSFSRQAIGPRAKAVLTSTEIVVEAATPRCERPLFPPQKEVLRGRWDNHNFPGQEMHQAISLMPNPIPGIRLGVDPVNRTCRRFDPLDTEEFADFRLQLEDHCSRHKEFLAGHCCGQNGEVRPWSEALIAGDICTVTTIKTWLYWMRQFVNGKQAIVIRGTAKLPMLDDIAKMPGKTQIQQGNEFVSYQIFREDFDEYGQFRPEWLAERGVGRGAAAGLTTVPLNPAGTLDMKAILEALAAAGLTIVPMAQAQSQANTGPSASSQSPGGQPPIIEQPPQQPRKGKPPGENKFDA